MFEFQILGNDTDNLKLHTRRNYEQTKFQEDLLLFDPEYFNFTVPSKKLRLIQK
jgi:hypothetical protein